MESIFNYKLKKGDCLELMKEIESDTIDMILADLPYGTTACKWDSIITLDILWKEYNRILKPGGVVVLFSAQPFTTKLINSNIKNYKYSWYWVKNTVTGFAFAKYQPMRKVEDINIFYKKMPPYDPQGLVKLDEPKQYRRSVPSREVIYDGRNTLCKTYVQEYTNYPNNVLYFDKEAKCVHPTQKPVLLLEYLIKTYTSEGMLVFDNCMGSGSTGVACGNTGRRFLGMEMNEDYYNISCGRISEAYLKSEYFKEKE